MAQKTIEQILAANLQSLMTEARNGLSSNPKLAHRTHLGTGTISRIRNAAESAKIDTVERIARAFGLHAIDLLVPHAGKVAPIENHRAYAIDGEPAPYVVKRGAPGLTQEERELLELFRRIRPDKRAVVHDLAQSLADMTHELAGNKPPLGKTGTA